MRTFISGDWIPSFPRQHVDAAGRENSLIREGARCCGLFDAHCKQEASDRNDIYDSDVNDVDPPQRFSLLAEALVVTPRTTETALPIHLRRSKGTSRKSAPVPRYVEID